MVLHRLTAKARARAAPQWPPCAPGSTSAPEPCWASSHAQVQPFKAQHRTPGSDLPFRAWLAGLCPQPWHFDPGLLCQTTPAPSLGTLRPKCCVWTYSKHAGKGRSLCAGELLRLEALPELAWLLAQHPRLALHGSHTCDLQALYAAHVQPCLHALLQLRGRRERWARLVASGHGLGLRHHRALGRADVLLGCSCASAGGGGGKL